MKNYLLACGLLAMAATAVSAKDTVQTVQFVAPVDMQSCFIAPIIRHASNYDWGSNQSGLSHADAEALTMALALVGAMVGGNVELSITRHGNKGSVHQVELTGDMRNGHFAVMYVGAEASSNADAASRAYASAWENVCAHADAYARNWVDLWSFMAGAYGSSHAYSCSSSNAYGYAYARSNADSDAVADAYSVSSDSTAAISHVYVKGANIKEFEGTLSMDGYLFTYLRAEAIADALAKAYASTYAHAYAYAYANAYTSASTNFYACINTWWGRWCYTLAHGYDYDSAYQYAYDSLWDSDYVRAVAAAHAEAVVSTLASSQLSVNLGVQFKNLPGTEDLLAATGSTSAVLTCSSSSFLDADALVEVQP